MRFLVRPLRDPDTALDLTEAVTEAIAQQLAMACGGNVVLNRIEAAAHLESLLRRATVPAGAANLFALDGSRVMETRPHPTPVHEEDTDAVIDAFIDSSKADRERQPQGFAVQRVSLERAG